MYDDTIPGSGWFWLVVLVVVVGLLPIVIPLILLWALVTVIKEKGKQK